MFNESDKVVCINDEFDQRDLLWVSRFPAQCEVYVVRAAFLHPTTKAEMIHLVGIHGAHRRNPTFEIGFKASRFRLLAEVRAENAQRAQGTAG